VYLRVGSKFKLKHIKSELIHDTSYRLPYKDITQSCKNNVTLSHKVLGFNYRGYLVLEIAFSLNNVKLNTACFAIRSVKSLLSQYIYSLLMFIVKNRDLNLTPIFVKLVQNIIMISICPQHN